MSITRSETNFYKKNGYLVKDQLISKKDINKLNTLINKIVTNRSNSYYPPRAKKVLNLISGFQSNNLKKCTLGVCIF